MTTNALILVPVTADDLEALAAFASAYADYDRHERDETTQRAALKQLCEGTAYARAFFITHKGRRIGYVSLAYGFSIEVGGLDFFLDEWFLEEAWRGRGFGRPLLAMIEAEARKLGAKRLCLETELHNPRAQRLYETSGYEAHKRTLLSKVLV